MQYHVQQSACLSYSLELRLRAGGPASLPKTDGSRYWPVDMNVITWLGIYYVKQEMPGAHALAKMRRLFVASFGVHGFGIPRASRLFG